MHKLRGRRLWSPLRPAWLAFALLGGLLAGCGGTDTTIGATSVETTIPATGCCVQGTMYFICTTRSALAACTGQPPDGTQCTLQVGVSCPTQ